jgi:1-acyl-sn-glycerol-3-phosphate acyltransferase
LNFRLIEMLLARLYRAACWLFGLRVEVRAGQQEWQEARVGALPEPVIVLARHAGPGDAFLLLYGLLAHAGRRPLLVLKHTLALDPWIDVLLGRVPHSFIDPGGHGDRAVALIRDLAAGLGDRDALVIFLKAVTSLPAAVGAPSTACGAMADAGRPGRRPASAMCCRSRPETCPQARTPAWNGSMPSGRGWMWIACYAASSRSKNER